MKQFKFAGSALAASVLALAACGTSPMSKVTSDTKFEDLMTTHLEFFPKSSSRETANKLLPQEVIDTGGTAGYVGAHNAFNVWCTKNKGRLHHQVTRADPGRIGELSAFVKEVAALGPKPWPAVDQRACELKGAVYILASGAAREGSATHIAWFSPDVLKAAEPAVAAARARVVAQNAAYRAAEQRRDAELARQSREREAQAAVAKQRFLENSPQGTQLTCSGNRAEDENIASLWYRCQGFDANFADFRRYGWRVAHQSIAPGTNSRGYQVAVVSLILEKFR